MTGAEIIILSIYAVIVAIWPIRMLVIEIVLRRQRVLSSRSPRFDQPDPPLVSAIVPAKDEELNIADCLESICRQTYPNLEILVVDDRSTDRTAEIARRVRRAATGGSACSRSSTCRRAGPARRTHSTRPCGHTRGQWLCSSMPTRCTHPKASRF